MDKWTCYRDNRGCDHETDETGSQQWPWHDDEPSTGDLRDRAAKSRLRLISSMTDDPT